MARPYVILTCPKYKNTNKDAKLLVKFNIFALADACKKSKPVKINHIIRNVPVPGPIKPSYIPMPRAKAIQIYSAFPVT